VIGEAVIPLAKACHESEEPVTIELGLHQLHSSDLDSLKALLRKNKGTIPVNVQLVIEDSWCLLQLGPEYSIQPGPVFDNDFNQWKMKGKTTHA
jgi:DNA polymerase-3 subunit alpha